MDRRGSSISNIVWFVVIGLTIILITYCSFPGIGKLIGTKISKKDMFVFVNQVLSENNMKMEKDKTYTYDFNSNSLIIKKKGD